MALNSFSDLGAQPLQNRGSSTLLNPDSDAQIQEHALRVEQRTPPMEGADFDRVGIAWPSCRAAHRSAGLTAEWPDTQCLHTDLPPLPLLFSSSPGTS